MGTRQELAVIVLAGGCFWCTEAVFLQVRGVQAVESGYSNGYLAHPRYEEVCTGQTGHAEVVRLLYDRREVTTRELLEVFFLIHDPTTLNRQGHDIGTQYRSGIYWSEAEQELVAMELIAEINGSACYSQPVVTEVAPVRNYWRAEEEHQNFFARNPQQAYCQAVAAPKIAKFRQTFARLQKG
ncbi:MAG: peptide-methionine (S)-S-oxide reductase MsrA [Rhodoferax sp.]